MKIGDEVLTNQGESGKIEKPWGRKTQEYDWWVRLRFWSHSKQRNFTSLIPYRSCELRINNALD